MKVSSREHCTWSGTGIGNGEEMSLEAQPEGKQRRCRSNVLDIGVGTQSKIDKKSGNYYVKFGHFVNFSYIVVAQFFVHFWKGARALPAPVSYAYGAGVNCSKYE